jgi:hypothetical protein
MSTTTSELLPPSSSLRVLLVSAGVLPTGEDISLDASLSVYTVEARSRTPPAPPKPRLRQDAPIFQPAKSRAPPAPAAPVRAGMDLHDDDVISFPRYVCTDRNTLVVAGLQRAAGCAGLVNLLVRQPHHPPPARGTHARCRARSRSRSPCTRSRATAAHAPSSHARRTPRARMPGSANMRRPMAAYSSRSRRCTRAACMSRRRAPSLACHAPARHRR